jgi:thiol-disulfide isomerase/thioredoxin
VSPLLVLTSAGVGERLAVALALVLGLVGLGTLARGLGRRRLARIASTARLAPSASGRPRLIAFAGPGCAACRVQWKIVEALRAEWLGGFEVEKIDAAAEPELARRFGVVLVPATVVAAADGRIVAINAGLADAAHLEEQLRRATPVYKGADNGGNHDLRADAA